jgi:two-component system, NarL family, invasion response regulator UvrY
MNKISVLIVDDHTLIRETWSKLLSLYPQYQVIATTGDGQEAIDIARVQKPDLILLDINMTPLNGFDILKMVRKSSPASKVVSVSMHSQPAYAKKMLRGGAKGYITKNSTSDELIDGLNEVVAGKTYICKEVKDILSQQAFSDSDEDPKVFLTERELEIIGHIKNGLSSKTIAAHLFITPKTVDVHRHNILKKLKVKNSVGLINYANEHGL